MKKKKIRYSIRNKILTLSAIAALPFIVMVVYLLISMSNYSKSYEQITKNLAIANNYNINFKDDMDESLYKLVVGYVTFDNLSGKETVKNPYSMIRNLRKEFTKLRNVTTQTESKMWLESLLRNIDTLEKRVDDIMKNVKKGGQYDENIKELDDNIYILTELIQDDIQYYIYYQMKAMDRVTTSLNHQVNQFLIYCTILIAILIFIVGVLTVFLVSTILRPINGLYRATGQIAEGNFTARASVTSEDEIAVLAEGFNEMAGNMQNLIGKIKEDEQKMRKADLRLLQEQINPHFLYNTLDNIVWLIESDEPDEAVDMVVTLSDFFRLVLSKGREFITIREEELHIRSYLQIQEKRYHDILEYDIQIDKVLYEYQILKLTLQPIVENALYHGIKYKRAKGYIHVHGEKNDDRIELTVRDNGVGMDEAELAELQKTLQSPGQEKEKGFGLANVNERIRMYFGSEYGLTVWSEKDKGTIVTVVIPAIPANREHEKKEEE